MIPHTHAPTHVQARTHVHMPAPTHPRTSTHAHSGTHTHTRARIRFLTMQHAYTNWVTNTTATSHCCTLTDTHVHKCHTMTERRDRKDWHVWLYNWEACHQTHDTQIQNTYVRIWHSHYAKTCIWYVLRDCTTYRIDTEQTTHTYTHRRTQIAHAYSHI